MSQEAHDSTIAPRADLSSDRQTEGLSRQMGVPGTTMEQEHVRVEDELVQSDQGVSLDLVQLYKALGGGWQETSKSLSKL